MDASQRGCHATDLRRSVRRASRWRVLLDDSSELIERYLVDTDVADAAKAVTRPDVGELRHLIELTSRNGGAVERIAPTAPWTGQDAELSRRLQLGLQLVAGQALRPNGLRGLASPGNGTTRGRRLSRLTVACRRQQ